MQQRVSFCWIPAGGAERPQCGNKRGVSPVSNERCKRRRSSATIANCNTYSPHPVRNSRGASGLKSAPIAPLLTVSPRRLLCHWQRAAPSCRKSSAARRLVQVRENGQLPECRQNKRPCIAWSFVLLDPGGYLLSRTVASQVPSAYEGLTSVFGMGTGGTLQLNHRKGVVFVNTLKTA